MKRSVHTCLFILSLLITGSAFAQATRTWVSGVGDDVNPCSRTAPCKTWPGAISKTAVGGVIDALDPGGFGAVTITKAITLEGNGGLASILVAGTNAIVIQIAPGPANRNVVLRNLLLEGDYSGLNGVRFLEGDSLTIEDSYIKAFTQNGIDFEPDSNPSHLIVHNTSVLSCGNLAAGTGAGIFVKPQVGGLAFVSIENTHMQVNNAGLRAEDNSSVTVLNSVASNNARNGVLANSTTTAVAITMEGSEASNNGTNGVATNGTNAFLRISNCVISGNAQGINQISGHLFSFQNNRITGNTIDGTPAPNTLTSQ